MEPADQLQPVHGAEVAPEARSGASWLRSPDRRRHQVRADVVLYTLRSACICHMRGVNNVCRLSAWTSAWYVCCVSTKGRRDLA